MAKYGKWLAGGLGWAFFGPIGGILGFVVGSMFQNETEMTMQSRTGTQRTTTGAYVTSLLVLIAAVMKADGKVLKSELDYVKQFLVRTFGASHAQEATQMLRDLLKQTIPLADVCHQIRSNMDHSSRLQLVHLLFGVAQADGKVDVSELNLIDKIASYLGISDKDFQSIKSMFVKDTGAAYKILEIEPEASDEEVKKAYRKMAMKYHPDKVSYLGEDIQKSANEKFQKVNEAYENIRKERNIA
ncbi:TerB family tellurite resistance protein [Sunxiuqinia sp. A32]|uniref:TerB family tellurite resistance protein n=1 Tax=Sunxiuqinia sp. A32 TaxID=3461496 RepID=UPI004045ED5B